MAKLYRNPFLIVPDMKMVTYNFGPELDEQIA